MLMNIFSINADTHGAYQPDVGPNNVDDAHQDAPFGDAFFQLILITPAYNVRDSTGAAFPNVMRQKISFCSRFGIVDLNPRLSKQMGRATPIL
jgi:hypothetical protein